MNSWNYAANTSVFTGLQGLKSLDQGKNTVQLSTGDGARAEVTLGHKASSLDLIEDST